MRGVARACTFLCSRVANPLMLEAKHKNIQIAIDYKHYIYIYIYMRIDNISIHQYINSPRISISSVWQSIVWPTNRVWVTVNRISFNTLVTKWLSICGYAHRKISRLIFVCSHHHHHHHHYSISFYLNQRTQSLFICLSAFGVSSALLCVSFSGLYKYTSNVYVFVYLYNMVLSMW